MLFPAKALLKETPIIFGETLGRPYPTRNPWPHPYQNRRETTNSLAGWPIVWKTPTKGPLTKRARLHAHNVSTAYGIKDSNYEDIVDYLAN